jgi:iron complex transport system substrate-binding protein
MALVVVPLVGLVACSDDDPDAIETQTEATAAPATPSPASSAEAEQTVAGAAEVVSGLMPPAEGKVTYPLTLTTSWGEVTIEERPERVVAASWRGDLSWLLALGVTPVAVESSDWALDAVPWAEERLAQPIEHTWVYEDLALEHEAIAAAEPDLIVAGSQGSEPVPNLEQLSAVAPVLGQPDVGVDYAGWQDQLLLLGQALDLQDRAQQVIDGYDTFFEEFRAEHPAFEGTALAFVGFHGQNDVWYGNPSGSTIEEFFTRMGFEPNPNDGLTDAEALSPELIGQIAGDIVVITDYSPPEDNGQQFTALVESTLFQSIPAVAAGKLLTLASPERTQLFHDGEVVGPMAHPQVAYNDPIGSPMLAEMLAPLLDETLAS